VEHAFVVCLCACARNLSNLLAAIATSSGDRFFAGSRATNAEEKRESDENEHNVA
jgi:hypothetical protein